jgi:hypothetical protein
VSAGTGMKPGKPIKGLRRKYPSLQPEYTKMQVIKIALIRAGIADLHYREKIRRCQIVLWVMKIFHVCPVVFQIEPQGKTGLYSHTGVIYGFAGFYFQTVIHFVFNSFP